jgi:hypothetical protein
MKKALHQPVILRHPHRTWLTPKGQVVTPHHVTEEHDPEPLVELRFTAKVVDTGTEEDISSYPVLKGSLSVNKNDSFQHQAEATYYEQLRWQDGDGHKPDIELLKRNVNAGIWAIETEFEKDQQDEPQPILNA